MYMWGWWWDGFFLFLVGMLLGMFSGMAAERRFGRRRNKETPLVLGAVLGEAVAITLWLSLPIATVAILGFVARIIAGATFGSFFVIIAEFSRVTYELKEARRAKESLSSE